MPFLVDEFTPRNYESVFFHRSIYDRLKKMSEDNSIPHTIFHGAIGAGKKVMTSIFLKMIYGDSTEKLYTTSYSIAGSGNKKKKETIQNSENHIIINPTSTNFDRYLVHEVVKRYAGSNTIELTQNPNSKFKTIQISNLDKLSHSAQTSLRRMIEVNASTCRFIMWCDNLSNVIGPLRSRCVCIRVPRPLKGELFAYLTYVAIMKRSNPSMRDLIEIVDYSRCNIKTALWCLQLNILGYSYKTNYDEAIKTIVKLILSCDLKKIEEIRDIFFNIWITNYEGVKIIRDVLEHIVNENDMTEECKLNIIIKTAELEYNLLRGRREIIHFDSVVTMITKMIQDHSPDLLEKKRQSALNDENHASCQVLTNESGNGNDDDNNNDDNNDNDNANKNDNSSDNDSDGNGIKKNVKKSKSKSKTESKTKAKPESKTKVKPESKTKTKLESKPESKTKAKPESKAKTKPESRTKTKPESRTKTKPESRTKAKPESRTKAKPESKAKTKPEPRTKAIKSKSEKPKQVKSKSEKSEKSEKIEKTKTVKSKSIKS
jgi:replication factor C subunit 3/5